MQGFDNTAEPAGTSSAVRAGRDVRPVEDLGPVSLHGHGPICRGRLEVADGALRFAAETGGSPLVGRADRYLALHQVRELRRDGAARVRVVARNDEVLLLSSPNADAVADRLRVLVSHAVTHALGAAEAPLLDALVTLVLEADGPEVVGRLVVDGRRLRFSPASAADADHILDVDVLSLVGPELASGPRFVAEIAGRRLQVLGPTAWGLYSLVAALQSGEGGEAAMARLPLVHQSARVWKGPLWCDGTLVFGARQLQFLPEEPTKNMLSMGALVIPGNDIGRVLLRGWPRKRLVVVRRDGRQTRLATTDPEGTMGTVLRCLHESQRLWVQDHPEEEIARSLLQTWAPVVPLEGEELLLSVLAIRATATEDLCPGVVLVTRRRVLFLPAGGPEGPAPADEFPISHITRSHSGDGQWRDAIRFHCGQAHHRYLPAGGAPVLRTFWDRCRAPSRIIPVDSSSRSLRELDGAARFVRIRQQGAPEVEVGPVCLQRLDRGWVLVIPRSHDLEIALGARLTIEIGRADGVVQFDTEAAPRAAPLPEDLPEPLPVALRENSVCIEVLPPAVVRLFNQRRAFRVPVDLAAEASPIPDSAEEPTAELPLGGAIGLHLVDLSTGGCAVHASQDLQEGARIDLRLPLGGREIHAAARVLRVERPPLGEPRYGLCFERIRQSDADCIHRHVLEQQRAALAS